MYKALTLPLLVTLFMHGLIVAIVLIDAPESKPLVRKAATKYIEAKLVTLEKPKPAPKPKSQVDSKAKQEAEQAKLREQEQQRQQQLREQQREQQQREKQLQEQQRQQRELQEKLAREQREREEQLRRQQQTERELAEAIAEEEAYMQAQSDAELANSYIALITQVIQSNWNRPPSARNNMEAELALQLIPTGEVVSVRVVKTSGNAAFDRSAEQAVLRSERFPELQQLPNRVFEQYFRRLNLRFRPEDLRL